MPYCRDDKCKKIEHYQLVITYLLDCQQANCFLVALNTKLTVYTKTEYWHKYNICTHTYSTHIIKISTLYMQYIYIYTYIHTYLDSINICIIIIAYTRAYAQSARTNACQYSSVLYNNIADLNAHTYIPLCWRVCPFCTEFRYLLTSHSHPC